MLAEASHQVGLHPNSHYFGWTFVVQKPYARIERALELVASSDYEKQALKQVKVPEKTISTTTKKTVSLVGRKRNRKEILCKEIMAVPT